MNSRAVGILCLMVLAFIGATRSLMAQSYPSRPVRVIVPFAPGGGSDLIGRLIAQKLSERLGQQVLVENKPGAGGNLGAELAVRAAPDGYTLLLIAGSYTVNPSLYKLSWDSANDITPIVQLSQGPFVLVVHPSVAARSLSEFIELARKQPDRFSFATAGSGSVTHLAAELFLDMARIKSVHVPYKGTGPALNDVMAGNVQWMLGGVATSLQYVKAGRLRALAVSTDKRIAAAPDVPTAQEAGLSGYEVVLWHGLVAPRGLAKPILDRLNAAANEALKGRDTTELLASDGVVPAGGTSAQFSALIKNDIERWRKVVQRANVRVE